MLVVVVVTVAVLACSAIIVVVVAVALVAIVAGTVHFGASRLSFLLFAAVPVFALTHSFNNRSN